MQYISFVLCICLHVLLKTYVIDSAASSVSWRLSPSSSGYKTQSQRSESITPSPTSTPYLSGDSIRQDSTNSMATNLSDIPTSQTDEQTEPQLVWAVTDIHNVPKGCIIIDPKVKTSFKKYSKKTKFEFKKLRNKIKNKNTTDLIKNI